MYTKNISEKIWDGVLYPIPDRKDKVVVVISGSEGGLKYTRKCAQYLQDRGIPALALGYFKTQNTQKYLDRVPLERIGAAIKWLNQNGYQKIAVEGISKGTEYAFAAAIQYPMISCVIAKTPSWFYSEGMINKKPSGTSCWSYADRELPYTPYKKRRFHMLKMLWKKKEFNILEVNIGKTVNPESVIPIEKIQGPILILSVEKDTIWPSKESGENLMKRLDEKHFPYAHKHISYAHMSHMMMEYCGSEIRYFIKSEREYPGECAKERIEMGNACVQWIEEVWK